MKYVNVKICLKCINLIITGKPYIISHGRHQQLKHRLCLGAASHSEPIRSHREHLCLPTEHQLSPGYGLPGC